MKNAILILCLIAGFTSTAQQYLTREGKITFDAGSPIEDIMATSESASAVYDASTGALGVQVLMTSFNFKRALMQEHFNENYVESESFPKAMFRGNFKEGRAIGQLTIHGVTKDIDVPAELKITDDVAELIASFPITIADFGVDIPSAVADKIDKQAKTEVHCTMKPRN